MPLLNRNKTLVTTRAALGFPSKFLATTPTTTLLTMVEAEWGAADYIFFRASDSINHHERIFNPENELARNHPHVFVDALIAG